MKYATGFTLIELLIAITIVALLTAVTVPAFLRFSARQELSQGVADVKTDLRTVQNRAISGIDRQVGGVDYYWWGIKFTAESGDYSFVKSSALDDPDSAVVSVREKSLSGAGLEIVADKTIWFKMITGEVFGSGAVVVRRVESGCVSQAEDPDNCRDVTVSAGGRVE